MTQTHRKPHVGCRERWATLVGGLLVALAVGKDVVAADLSVRAQLSPTSIAAGETATLSIEISGAQDVPPPALTAPPGVQIDYIGPATQVTIVNGRIQASVQHRYSVTAAKPGTYSLGPFSIAYRGRRYETEALTLNVGASRAAALQEGGALRLVIRVPRTQVYLREKIPVDVLLYVGAVRAGDLQYPTLVADGFALERFQEPVQYQEQVEGQTFTVVRFSSSLTPLRSGPLTLGPASTRLNVYERRRGGFFDDPFFSQRRPVSLESNSVTLDVHPLPEEGKPKNFSGAVGRFSLHVEAFPAEVRVGDPVTLRIVLRGQGNLDGVPPPALPELPPWRVYEPHPVASEPGTLAFEQVVIPVATVDAVPSIEFAYFDPELGRYRTERSTPITLTVRQRADTPPMVVAGPTPALPEKLGRDIVYLKEHPGRWIRLQEGLSPTLLAGHAGLLLLPLASYLFDRRRQRMQTNAFAQRTAASRLARHMLQQCRQALLAKEPQLFYETLATSLRDYVTLRFGLPPGRVDEIPLGQLSIDNSVREQLATLFRACEEARFGKHASADQLDHHWDLLQKVLEESERLDRRRWLQRLGFATLVLLCAIPAAHGASPDSLFFQGNAAYAAQDYNTAIGHYEAALRQGVASANLFFNLGNAYFKAGQLGKAILNYERAQWLAPRDADIAANLEFARAEAKISTCATPLSEQLLFPLAGRVSPGGLELATSLLYGMAVVAWSVALLPVGARHRWRIVAVGASVAFVITGANLLWLEYGRSWSRHAVALQATSARFAPEVEATEHFRVPPGALLKTREQRGDWTLVERCDGRRGWVPLRSIELLAPTNSNTG